jgi:hypothetical protein
MRREPRELGVCVMRREDDRSEMKALTSREEKQRKVTRVGGGGGRGEMLSLIWMGK